MIFRLTSQQIINAGVMLKLNHKNLDVWKLAVKLVSTIYQSNFKIS